MSVPNIQGGSFKGGNLGLWGHSVIPHSWAQHILRSIKLKQLTITLCSGDPTPPKLNTDTAEAKGQPPCFPMGRGIV